MSRQNKHGVLDDWNKIPPALCAKCDCNRVPVWARRVAIIQESSGEGV